MHMPNIERYRVRLKSMHQLSWLEAEARSEPAEAGELESFFELGGPAFRFMQRVGIVKGRGPSIGRRTVAFIAVTWVPMLLFSIIEGCAIGPTPRQSLLLDFATYARLFLAVPLIFAAESVVGPRMRIAGLRFVEAGIVSAAEHDCFVAAAARARHRRDAILPEVLFLVLAACGAWFLTVEQLGGLSVPTWHVLWTEESGPHLMPAGLWYNFVAIPLVQFFLLRWLWRLVIWTLFLWDMSRLRLNLTATHADGAGGLGFLGTAHLSLAIFPFAMSFVLAGEIAFRVKFEGLDIATMRTMAPLLFAYIAFVEIATFGPLLVLTPLLARVRREGLRTYGILVQQHNQLFHDKWIAQREATESPLGNPDMSSLIDLGSSFDLVRKMQILPVGRGQFIQVALVACIPGLPLALLVLPLAEVVRLLVGIVV